MGDEAVDAAAERVGGDAGRLAEPTQCGRPVLVVRCESGEIAGGEFEVVSPQLIADVPTMRSEIAHRTEFDRAIARCCNGIEPIGRRETSLILG